MLLLLRPLKQKSVRIESRTMPTGVALVVLLGALVLAVTHWVLRTEYFWKSPIDGARFQSVTDWDGVEQAAAVSRDGQFVAFFRIETDKWTFGSLKLAQVNSII